MDLKKGDNVSNMTEEERKAFRLSVDPDEMGSEDHIEGDLDD